MKNHTAHFAVLAALLFAGTAVFAADSNKVEKHDVTLKSGKVLKDAYILDRKPNGITFGYKDGCSFVRFTDLVRQFEIITEEGVSTMQYFDFCTFEDDITLPSEMFHFSPERSMKLSLVSFETNVEIPEDVFRKPEQFSVTEGDK